MAMMEDKAKSASSAESDHSVQNGATTVDALPVVEQYHQWPSSKFADPKNVDDGIRLNKPISELVKSWWSRRWLSIIEQFGLGVRLERAKFYANRGQVLSIQIENGVVRSQVQGAESDPYRVIIAVKTLPKAIWTSILSDFSHSSRFGVSLASRLLPAEEEIDRVFRNNGVLLFPDRQGEMQTKCSCLDWSNPCKHIVAVYLLLAAEFENDPFLIFKLRGLAMPDLFKLLQSHTPAACEAPHPVPQEEQTKGLQLGVSAGRNESLSGLSRSQQNRGLDVKAFWKQTVKSEDVLDSWTPPSDCATLPASLGDFPFWQGHQQFLLSVRVAYESAPAQAMQLLMAARNAPGSTD